MYKDVTSAVIKRALDGREGREFFKKVEKIFCVLDA